MTVLEVEEVKDFPSIRVNLHPVKLRNNSPG